MGYSISPTTLLQDESIAIDAVAHYTCTHHSDGYTHVSLDSYLLDPYLAAEIAAAPDGTAALVNRPRDLGFAAFSSFDCGSVLSHASAAANFEGRQVLRVAITEPPLSYYVVSCRRTAPDRNQANWPVIFGEPNLFVQPAPAPDHVRWDLRPVHAAAHVKAPGARNSG